MNPKFPLWRPTLLTRTKVGPCVDVKSDPSFQLFNVPFSFIDSSPFVIVILALGTMGIKLGNHGSTRILHFELVDNRQTFP